MEYVVGNKVWFTINEVKDCFKFAHDMEGKHKKDISRPREDWQVFIDDLQGKLGEVAVKKYIEKNNLTEEELKIDFKASNRGIWDENDLIVYGKYLNVKSIKGYSSFLMVETSRYYENGKFTYKNNNGEDTKVDYYVVVRIHVEGNLEKEDFKLNFEEFSKKYKKKVHAEILGGISHDGFWKEKTVAKAKIICNKNNLDYIIKKGECVEKNLPCQPTGKEDPKSDILLQVDNYIVGKEKLHDLKKIFDSFSK